MPRKKRVLLRGFYNLHNFGDDLIFIAWINFLSRVLKFTNQNLELYITEKDKSLNKLNFESQLNLGCLDPPDVVSCINEKFKSFHLSKRIPITFNLIIGRTRKPRIIYFFSFILATMIVVIDVMLYKCFSKSLFINEYLDFLKNLDAIHYLGGGYFTEGWKNEVLRYETLQVLLAKKVNPDLKIIGTGLGVGPFKNGLNKVIFKFFAKNCDYLFVRDKMSLELLEKLKVNVYKKALGDDVILLLPYLETLKNKKKVGPSSKIALNLKDFPAHDYSRVKRNIENYIRSMVSQGNTLAFFLFGTKPGPCDRKVLQVFDDEYTTKLAIHNPYEDGWSDFLENLAQAEVGLGFAYHFCVLMTLLGVSVVSSYSGEYYQQKMEGAVKLLNKNSVVLPIRELASRNINDVMDAAKGLKQKKPDWEMVPLYQKMVAEYAKVYEKI